MADLSNNVVMVDFTNSKDGNRVMRGANAAKYAIDDLIENCNAWSDVVIAGYLGEQFKAVAGIKALTPEMKGFLACLSCFCGCVAQGDMGNSYPLEERK